MKKANGKYHVSDVLLKMSRFLHYLLLKETLEIMVSIYLTDEEN